MAYIDDTRLDSLEGLLPWSKALPDNCRSRKHDDRFVVWNIQFFMQIADMSYKCNCHNGVYALVICTQKQALFKCSRIQYFPDRSIF